MHRRRGPRGVGADQRVPVGLVSIHGSHVTFGILWAVPLVLQVARRGKRVLIPPIGSALGGLLGWLQPAATRPR